MDLTRRDAIKAVAGTVALGALSGGATAQTASTDTQDVQEVTFLLGDFAGSPNEQPDLQPGGGFFSGADWEKTRYGYVLQDTQGDQWYVTQDMDRWERLNEIAGLKIVRRPEDLPPAENGVRRLNSDYNGYWFVDIIADPATLNPNGVPMVGFHGAAGGYVHTGGTIGFQTDGGAFSVDNFFGHAPGAQLFDLHADNTTRFYVTDSAFFDPGGLYGDIANLGVVDGYKVQSFKSVNFENWAQGLTVAGSPDKTFFDTCPFRQVSGADATVVTGAADYTVDILKFIGDYVKDVQSDTTVVDLSASGLPNNYFKYINVDHDETFNKAQVFNGFATNDVGVLVRNSFPLANSTIVGDLTLDAPIEPLAGSGADPTTVTQGTWTLNLDLKTSKPSPGVIQYDAKRDHNMRVDGQMTVAGANTEFAVYVARNGSVIPRSRREDSTAGANKPTTVNYSAQIPSVTSDTPDQFTLALENIGGTTDLDVLAANIVLGEI